jgi:hypothetical protein
VLVCTHKPGCRRRDGFIISTLPNTTQRINRSSLPCPLPLPLTSLTLTRSQREGHLGHPIPRVRAMATPYNHTYSEYLGSILPQWPEFRGLYEFLTNPALPTRTSGKAIIIDKVNGGGINARRFVNDSVHLDIALSQRLPDISTRIVILQYAEAKSLSPRLVDVIATRYHFSPVLLCSHLLDQDSNASSYRPLCSHAQAFEFGFYQFLHASIVFLPSNDPGQSGVQNDTGNWTSKCPLLRKDSRTMYRDTNDEREQ